MAVSKERNIRLGNIVNPILSGTDVPTFAIFVKKVKVSPSATLQTDVDLSNDFSSISTLFVIFLLFKQENLYNRESEQPFSDLFGLGEDSSNVRASIGHAGDKTQEGYLHW